MNISTDTENIAKERKATFKPYLQLAVWVILI
jgi:hypothetical protein